MLSRNRSFANFACCKFFYPDENWTRISREHSAIALGTDLIPNNRLFFQLERQERQAAEGEDDEAGSQTQEEEDPDKDYDYLLGMTFWSLTMERKNELLKKRDDKMTELNILKKKAPTDLWSDDLDALREKVSDLEWWRTSSDATCETISSRNFSTRRNKIHFSSRLASLRTNFFLLQYILVSITKRFADRF